jgi:predicted DNA binding CopG/RHH family protein
MARITRLTESDLNRLVRRIIKEGVEIEMVTADYDDVSKNMRPGTQTSATLYFDKDKSIMLRVGSANLLLFGPPIQAQPAQTQPAQKRPMDDRLS